MKLWISILLVCFAEIALADERDRRERERQERIESIRSELATIPDHPWAGESTSVDHRTSRLIYGSRQSLGRLPVSKLFRLRGEHWYVG